MKTEIIWILNYYDANDEKEYTIQYKNKEDAIENYKKAMENSVAVEVELFESKKITKIEDEVLYTIEIWDDEDWWRKAVTDDKNAAEEIKNDIEKYCNKKAKITKYYKEQRNENFYN